MVIQRRKSIGAYYISFMPISYRFEISIQITGFSSTTEPPMTKAACHILHILPINMGISLKTRTMKQWQ